MPSLPFFSELGTEDWILCGDLNIDIHRPTPPQWLQPWLQWHRTNFVDTASDKAITRKQNDSESRIDFITVSKCLASRALNHRTWALPTKWSDHHLLLCDIKDDRLELGKGAWRFNPHLLSNESFGKLLLATMDLLLQQNPRDMDPDIAIETWENTKRASSGGTFGTLSFAQVLAKNKEHPIPRGADRQPERSSFFSPAKPISELLFQVDNLEEKMQVHRAERILQYALNPNTVLLEVPLRPFKDIVAIYDLIRNKLGNFFGVTVVQRDYKCLDSVLLNVAFKDPESTRKAIENGLDIDGLTIKATPGKPGSDKPLALTRVHLSRLPIHVSDEELKEGLYDAMSPYGTVMDIRKVTRMGHFEGHGSVLLDLSEEEDTADQEPRVPLSRMIYLPHWDSMAFASYKGAEKICYYCRQEGHLKRDCKERKAIKCYKCQQEGHIAKWCPNMVTVKRIHTRQSEEEIYPEAKKSHIDADQEELPKAAEAEPATDTQTVEEPIQAETAASVTPSATQQHQRPTKNTEEDGMNMDEASSVSTEEMEIADDAHKDKLEMQELPSMGGTKASKHAPYAVSTSMKVDSAEEMTDPMEMTPTVNAAKVRTIRAFVTPPTKPEDSSGTTTRQ
ncbi:hypothetical protein BC940DRAFT_352574 [Gongronella butleri]|nr:hypothetical protein BC940DRAFT_352574 [Gongronella butleri]